jgi:hypothetical protein
LNLLLRGGVLVGLLYINITETVKCQEIYHCVFSFTKNGSGRSLIPHTSMKYVIKSGKQVNVMLYG